jgi:hypothetical protein
MVDKPNELGEEAQSEVDAIHAAMADTRAALTRKLEALQQRVLGTGAPTPNQGEPMAVKKKATKTAKKSGSAAKGKKTKKAAPAKKAAARKTTKAKSKTKPKTAVAKVVGKAKLKKSPAKATKKKTLVAKVMEKAKEILGGAAVGAVQGAAATIAPPPEPTPASEPAPSSAPAQNSESQPSQPSMW